MINIRKQKNNLQKFFSLYKFYNNRKLVEQFSVHYPNSKNHFVYSEATFSSANNTFLLFSEFAQLNYRFKIQDAPDFFPESQQNSDEWKKIFDSYGSDKANFHNYHFVYSSILNLLQRKSQHISLLEIGLGTNDPTMPSNMGTHGKPGASLRAFRDMLPKASVYGADIDRNILFSEERIQTCFIDQLEYKTYQNLGKEFNLLAFDLIIDDGLHSPEANLNTVKFALEGLAKDGWLVVEDIPERSLSVWIALIPLVNKFFDCWVVHCNGYYLFVARKY